MSGQSTLFRERFRFQSQALDDENVLRVMRFKGTEGLNMLYSFDIMLATQETSLPLENMLAQPARLVILREDGQHATFSGLPTAIEQTSRFNGWTFYRLTLQPAFWKFTQIVQNSFHIDKNVQEIIDSSLDSIDYFDVSHEFRLLENYAKQEFSMQYNESIYDFMAWKMERDGIYYFFDEKDEGEHLVFADAPNAHEPLENTPDLYYSPTSGLEATHKDEVISMFSLKVTPLPRQVVLRDYDYTKPNGPVVAEADVSPQGLGTVYYYGEGFTTEDEGSRLAKIRAQALACRGRIFSGEGSVPTLRPGHTFNLKDHYDDDFNRDYMLVSVTHEGSQEAWLSQAVGVPIEREDDRLFYRNSFTCIPADAQFRPERKTERAKVSGMVSAFVDASTTSGKPDIDGKGRYKVVFPQDDSGRSKGKASCWLRRMQPHVGKGQGTVFPLSPGVEVMVSFVDGNPDRPFIAGAVANAETGTMEYPGTSNVTGLRADGDNSLLFHNKGGKHGMHMKTGGRSGMFMASGSLDTSMSYSDLSSNVFTATQSTFAGMGSKFMGGFESSMSVSADSYKSGAAILPALTSLGKLGQSISDKYAKDDADNQDADNASKAFSNINSAIKIAQTAYDFVQWKKNPIVYPNYGISLSTNHKAGASGLVTRNYPTRKLFGLLVATTAASVAARVLTLVGDSIKQVHEEEHKQNKQKRKAFGEIKITRELGENPSSEVIARVVKAHLDVKDINQVLGGYDRAKIKALIKSKLTPMDLSEIQVKSGGIGLPNEATVDAAIEANFADYCIKHVPFVKDALIKKAKEKCAKDAKDYELENTDATKGITADDINKQLAADAAKKNGDQSYFKKETKNKKWGKGNAIVKNTVDSVASLIAEVTALHALNKKTADLDEEKFGGVNISSADRNVVVSSKTESRMVSNETVVLRAMPGERENASTKKHTEIAKQINKLDFGKKSDTYLLMSAENTYSGSFKKAKILAGDELTLGGNKKILLSTKNSDLALLKKDAEEVAQKPTRADVSGLDVSGFADVSKSDYKAYTPPPDGEKKYSILNMEETKIGIMTRDESVQNALKNGYVSIKPARVMIVAKEAASERSAVTLTKNRLTVTAKSAQLTMDGAGNKITAKAKEINMDASAGNLNLKGQKVNISDKITIDTSSIKANAGGNLTLDGGMIKIG